MTTLLHRLEGRLRLRVSRIKNNHSAAASLQTSLATMNGVQEVRTNAITASVLIVYDPWRLSETDFLDLFGITALEDPPSSTPHQPLHSLSTVLARRLLDAAIEVALWRFIPCAF
jgi:hypothetical protein